MYELTILEGFSAAHRLPRTGGKCEALHGHNWKVEVQIAAETLNDTGMVVDFQELQAATRKVLSELDHSFLNDHPFFRDSLPTAENLARFVYESLAGRIAPARLLLRRVRVWESDHTAASYSEEGVS